METDKQAKLDRQKRLNYLIKRTLAEIEENKLDLQLFDSELSALRAEILHLHMEGNNK